jgi:dihydrofolate reductase
MAKLIYSAITSLDGYPADENGNFDWAAPDEEVHAFVNNLERPVATYFDLDEVRRMKARPGPDTSLGGPYLAAQAIRAGLVDELHVLVSPVVVGAGTPFLPADVRLRLELLDERRFGNGVIHLHYGTSA